LFTDAVGFTYLTDTAEDFVLGGTTTATAKFFFDTSASALYLGTNESSNGSITLFSSGAGITDATISTNASGDLTLSAPSGAVVVGDGSGDIQLQLSNPADTLEASKTASLTVAYVDSDFSFTRSLSNSSNTQTSSGSVLSVVDNSTLVAGTTSDYNLIFGNAAPTGGSAFSGSLLRLQTSSTDRFVVSNNGAVTTGIWQGSTIGIAYGGTNSTATPTAGAIAYGTGSAYAFTAQGTSGQCLQSGGAGSPTWGSCGAGAFSSITLAGTSGTPQTINEGNTITIAAGTNITTTAGATDTVTVAVVDNPSFSGLVSANGGLTVVGTSNIGTTAGNTTNIGNTTGILTVVGNSSSTFALNGVTVTATEFNRLSGKDAPLIDTNDAVNTAITGTGDLSTGSIASGFGTIATTNTITGTTINGTTGINTGASAGTQRIDASGNLVNIGNITGTGAVTLASTGGANALTLTSGSGTIILGASTVQRSGASLTYDIANGASPSTFAITNSGAGVASLTVEGGGSFGANLSITSGGISVTGNSTINGTLTSLTGLTSSGTITFSGLNTAGLVQTNASGVLSTGAVNRNSATYFNTALTVANGGTGATSFTTNGVLYGNNTGAVLVTAASTVANQCLITPTAGSAPVWGSCLAGGGGTLFTQASGFIYLTNQTDDLVIGGNSAATASLYVDESAGSATLGNSTLAGALKISDGSSNEVTIDVSGVSTNYTLRLPTSSGSSGQCLKNSSTPGYLEYANCNNGSGSGGA
jgi:hypothetical protein